MVRDEVLRILPGTGLEKTSSSRYSRSSERRGKSAAGTVTAQCVHLSDTAHAVVIPMTGEGDRQFDRVSWGKENRTFL